MHEQKPEQEGAALTKETHIAPISVSQAFGEAPPRSTPVVCFRGPEGSTDLVAATWFTWLNLKRQPMLSFSLNRETGMGGTLESDDALYLAFPPAKDAVLYEKGVRTAAPGKEKPLPDGVELGRFTGIPLPLPVRARIILRCTLAGAYNYPFKKVRIYNCNLEEALKANVSGDAPVP